MAVMIGVVLVLAGGLAAIAGLSGLRRARRLRRDGAPAWALAVSPPAAAGEERQSRRTLIQYALADGRVVERLQRPDLLGGTVGGLGPQHCPQPARKAGWLRPGQHVLVWYSPEDPQDVLVYGREGHLADRAFVAAGALIMLTGAGIAGFAH
jgi:hypothetical protein